MFDFLPTVQNCCFCLNLRIGAILIGICGFVSLGSLGYIAQFPICGETEGMLPDLLKYFGYTSLGINVLMLITSLIFIIGACMDRFGITALIFLISITLFLLINLACLLLILVAIITDGNCREHLPFHLGAIIIPLWLYFMIVIRSYKDEME